MVRRNLLSVIIAMIIMYLSLAGSDNFNKVPFLNIPYFDKIAHFGMYFTFMAALLFENRIKINGFKNYFILALIPLGYGILMEVCQGLFTSTRTPSFFDVLANSSGIIIAILIWYFVKPRILHFFR